MKELGFYRKCSQFPLLDNENVPFYYVRAICSMSDNDNEESDLQKVYDRYRYSFRTAFQGRYGLFI